MANQAIWKFPLTITDKQDVEMATAADILCCQMQGGMPCLWVACDTDAQATRKVRHIEIRGTGHLMDDCNRAYIGTVQMQGGSLVFHVFERMTP